MDGRVLALLFVLGLSWCCGAREMVTTYKDANIISVLQTNFQRWGREIQTAKVARNENVCTLCEEFTADAITYLSKNKTQTEIIEALHQSCSKMLSFRQQCIALVDYYAPLFFLEISSIQPGDFCQRVNLCEQVVHTFQHLSKDSCDLCHRAVMEALLKLKDPDTELELLELLLKACDATESYAKKCKKLVFEYGPVILANAEQFLEKNDICTMLHACSAAAEQFSPNVERAVHSAS